MTALGQKRLYLIIEKPLIRSSSPNKIPIPTRELRTSFVAGLEKRQQVTIGIVRLTQVVVIQNELPHGRIPS